MIDRVLNPFIVEVHENDKRPCKLGWTKKRIKRNPKHTGNYGILTGKVNNIIVLDIDVKDNGLKYWDNITEEHEEPQTFTIRTGSGGKHYYFNYNPNLKSGNKIFKDGNKLIGIDMLSDGKMAMAHGSIHPDTGKKYTIENDAPIADVPDWFIKLYNERTHTDEEVAQEEKIKKPGAFDIIKGRIYNINDDDLNKLLNELPTCFYDDYNKWLIITNILKGMNKKEIWDKFSKKSERYNAAGNEDIWQNIKPFININYIINYYNKLCGVKKPFIKHTINYKPITDIQGIKEEKITARYLKEYLQDKDDDLNKLYNTLIIKSDTGTGKTTYTSHKFKDEEYIISISSRRSLVEQQIETFAKEKIIMEDYRKNINANKICIQFDSIWKLTETADADEKIKNSVVYLDEMNSSLKYLLRTETMRKKRIAIFQALIKIIKNAKYVMATDADISDLCFKFIYYFRDINKTLYINNDYKNYSNLIATQQTNIADIIKLMDKDIKEGRYFVATFDTVSKLEMVAAKLEKDNNRHDFLKIHSKGHDNTSTENWKNKYVFYSPKIIYGTDFNPPEKTAVYVFCSGRTIDTLEIAQQMTRCRKILNVNYYFDAPERVLNWDNIQEYEEHIRNNLNKYCDVLKEFGCIILSFDCSEYILHENMFYELFLYSDYINKIITSNYLYHFNKILFNKGFITNEAKPTKEKITKKQKQELKELSDSEYDDICEKYAQGIRPEGMDDFLETIDRRMNLLNINKYNYTDPKTVDEEDKEEVIAENKKRYDIITKNKKYIFHDKHLKIHFNIINMCKIEEEIKSAIEKTTDYKVKAQGNINIKILLLNELDHLAERSRFDMTEPTVLEKKAIKNIASVIDIVNILGIKLDTLKNQYTMAEIYNIRVKAYKKIIGEHDNGKGKAKAEKEDDAKDAGKGEMEKGEDKKIIQATKQRIKMSKEKGKSDRLQIYMTNYDKIKEHLEVYQERDPSFNKINPNIIKQLGLIPKEAPETEKQNEYAFIEE